MFIVNYVVLQETENGVNPSVIATNDDMDSYTSDESDDQGIVIVKGRTPPTYWHQCVFLSGTLLSAVQRG